MIEKAFYMGVRSAQIPVVFDEVRSSLGDYFKITISKDFLLSTPRRGAGKSFARWIQLRQSSS
jgi:hypothetical protein